MQGRINPCYAARAEDFLYINGHTSGSTDSLAARNPGIDELR